MTTPVTTPKLPKLEKFAGIKSHIKVASWITLFEVVARTANKTTDADKTGLLIEYLEGEALQWYADEVAANIDTAAWVDSMAKMKTRFGERTIDPVLAAHRRKFNNKTDTVQSYFEDKMYHLRKTKLEESSMAELLTDGMPHYYRTPLIASNVTSSSDWLNKAVRLESSFSSRPALNEQPGHKAISVNMADRKPKKTNKPPPGPCKICSKIGKENEMHWHSDCPNRKPKTPNGESSNHSSGTSYESINMVVQKN